MPIQILKPVGGLNIDTAPKYLTAVQYPFSKNHYYAINQNEGTGDIAQGNNEAVGTPAPSNVLFAPLPLPAGINQNIGAFEFQELGEVYFFNWNSGSKHGIYRMRIADGAIDKIKEGNVFPFDIKHPISEHNVHLRLAYNSPLQGATTIWKWLIWTDGNEWQGFVDVESAIATDGYNSTTYPYFKKFAPHCDETEFFQLGVRPHFYCPSVTVVSGNDPDTTTFRVSSTNIDLNPYLNGINDEELDADSENIDRDRTEDPMGSRLLALNSKGRLYPGLSDSHEVIYLDGDDTALSGVGFQINGIRFKLGIYCDGSQPQFDATAILNGLACGIHAISYFGATLDMIIDTGAALWIAHNPRINDVAQVILAINAFIDRGGDIDKIVVFMGFEFGDPNAYPDPNSAIFPTPADYVTSQQIAANAIVSAFPTAKIVLPAGKVFKSAAWIIPWNTALRDFALTGSPKIYMNNYFKLSDLYTPSEIYEETNWRNTMIDGTTITFSEYIQLFKTFFPDNGLFIPYMGTDGGPEKIADYLSINSMLGLAMLHRQLILEHVADPNLILGVAHYKPGSMKLQNETPRYDYFELLKFVQLFQYVSAKVCTVETGISGVYGIASKSGSNYTIYIINVNNDDSPMPPISLDGLIVTDFVGTVSRGISLDSTDVINESFDGVTIPGLAIAILNTT